MVQVISQIRNAKLMGVASDIYAEAKILELFAIQINQNSTASFDYGQINVKALMI